MKGLWGVLQLRRHPEASNTCQMGGDLKPLQDLARKTHGITTRSLLNFVALARHAFSDRVTVCSVKRLEDLVTAWNTKIVHVSDKKRGRFFQGSTSYIDAKRFLKFFFVIAYKDLNSSEILQKIRIWIDKINQNLHPYTSNAEEGGFEHSILAYLQRQILSGHNSSLMFMDEVCKQTVYSFACTFGSFFESKQGEAWINRNQGFHNFVLGGLPVRRFGSASMSLERHFLENKNNDESCDKVLKALMKALPGEASWDWVTLKKKHREVCSMMSVVSAMTSIYASEEILVEFAEDSLSDVYLFDVKYLKKGFVPVEA
jgi:hypothetical protein